MKWEIDKHRNLKFLIFDLITNSLEDKYAEKIKLNRINDCIDNFVKELLEEYD